MLCKKEIPPMPCSPTTCVSFLGDCKPAYPPCIEMPYGYFDNEIQNKEKGNNPMAYDTKTTSAVASIIQTSSDESKQREYLLKEYDNLVRYRWQMPFFKKLQEMFNIDAPTTPETAQALIDAFKNGTVSIDQKKVDRQTKFFASKELDFADDDIDFDIHGSIHSKWYGITFTGMPKADRKGYDTAIAELDTLIINTKRAIIVGTPAEGLAALIALENFTPSNAPAATAAA